MAPEWGRSSRSLQAVASAGRPGCQQVLASSLGQPCSTQSVSDRSNQLRAAGVSHSADEHGAGAGQLLSTAWWASKVEDAPPIPEPDLLQRVLRDVFKAPRLPFQFQAWPLISPEQLPGQASSSVQLCLHTAAACRRCLPQGLWVASCSPVYC